MISLVGYTGFVGSNIYFNGKGNIDKVYNSTNISDAYGTKPDLLIYAGLRAEKYLANNNPQKDMELIIQAEENIERIAPKNLVLISTIDVLKNPIEVDENTRIEINGLHAYGFNRYKLELWARDYHRNTTIIRLPALFGRNIKKNFLYDYINVIPTMLKSDKYKELCQIDHELERFYFDQGNGFYKVNVDEKDRLYLRRIFNRVGFSAIDFTDSRSIYQFYDLGRLWSDINTCLNNGITLWHSATEPISASEIYKFLTGHEFVNLLPGTPAKYDYRTLYSEVFSGSNGYIRTKDDVLSDIRDFIVHQSSYQTSLI